MDSSYNFENDSVEYKEYFNIISNMESAERVKSFDSPKALVQNVKEAPKRFQLDFDPHPQAKNSKQDSKQNIPTTSGSSQNYLSPQIPRQKLPYLITSQLPINVNSPDLQTKKSKMGSFNNNFVSNMNSGEDSNNSSYKGKNDSSHGSRHSVRIDC